MRNAFVCLLLLFCCCFLFVCFFVVVFFFFSFFFFFFFFFFYLLLFFFIVVFQRRFLFHLFIVCIIGFFVPSWDIEGRELASVRRYPDEGQYSPIFLMI